MDSIDGTGLPTQPQQQTPQAPRKWSEIELESSIYSLEPQDRIGLFDQWAKQAQDYQLKAGGFDNPENFQKFKIKEIQTRRRLLSPMGDDPDPAVVQQDYKAYIDMIGEEQKRQAAKKPDQKVYQEVLDGKRNAAFVGGQMIFNPKVTRDPVLYRQALAETDAPSDIKVIYAGRREDEDKRASITRRDELASKIVTPQIAERVVSAVQEGTEILGVNVGSPQDAGIRKDVNGIWSVADPYYVDWDKGIVSGVMSKALPGAAAQYKPMKELNEFQKKYGLSDDEMKADYMEALKRSAPTSVSRWVTNADSLEDYVPVLSSKVRVLDPDIKPRIFVPNADLAFDKEAYDAVVDSAKAPEEAKTLAKESRTQIAKSLALPTYNLLLNNRDDFMPYAEKVKSKDDMVDAVSKYYKDKKDQSWYEDLNEFVDQAGGGLDTGVRRFYNLRNVIPAMFGDVEAAENAAAIERDLSDENRVREMVSSRMGMPTAFKITRDIAAIAPDLAAQFAISMLTGGVGTSVAAASIASRTGLKYAAARAALGAAMTGAKQPALRGLVAKIPGVAAGSVDNVATAAIDAAKQLTTKNPLKGGLGTQQLVSGATAGLASMSGTFSEVYSSLRDEGMPPEQALDKARNSAAVAAAITSAITYGFSAFGRGGAEDAATTQMRQSGQFTVRDLVSAGIPELLTTEGGRQAIKKTAVGFLRKPGDEALEEALDQFAGGLAQYVTNPSKEAQDKSMSEIIQESLYAGLLGGIVGGGIASLEQATLTAGGSTAPQIEAEMLGAGAVPPAAPPTAAAPAAPTPSPAASAPAVPAPTPPAPTPTQPPAGGTSQLPTEDQLAAMSEGQTYTDPYGNVWTRRNNQFGEPVLVNSGAGGAQLRLSPKDFLAMAGRQAPAPAPAATVVPPAPTVTASGPPVTPAVAPSVTPPAPPLAPPPPAPTFRQLAGTSVLVDNEAGSIKIDDDGTVLFDRGPNTPPIILSRNQDELVSSSEFNVRSAFPVELTPSAPTSVRDDGAIVTTSTGTKGAVSIVTDFVSEGETAEGNLFVTVRDRETGSEFELHGDDALVVAIARRNRQQDNDLDAAITAATPPQLLDFNRVLARLLAGKQNLLEVSNDESGQVFSQEKIDAAFEELVSLNTAIQNENLPADIRERLTQTIDNALNELASRRSQSQPGAAAASVGAETAAGAPSRGGAAQTGNVPPAKPAGAETRVSAAVQNATVVAQNLAQNPDTSITAAALQQVANQTPAQPVAAPAPVTPAPEVPAPTPEVTPAKKAEASSIKYPIVEEDESDIKSDTYGKTIIGTASNASEFDNWLRENGVGDDQLTGQADQGVGVVNYGNEKKFGRKKIQNSAIVYRLPDGTLVAWSYGTKEIFEVPQSELIPNDSYKATIQNVNEKPARLLTPEEFHQREVSVLGGAAKKDDSALLHESEILPSIKTRKDVSAVAVEAYGITLPEGYVKQGDLYVYSPEAAPEPTEATAVVEKPKRPSLGTTGREIMQAWKSLQGTNVATGENVVGLIVGGGTFAFINDKIVRLSRTKDWMATYTEATKNELSEIDDAINKGQFQIESRKNTGLGMYPKQDAGKTTRILHQATGKPLPEFLATPEGKAYEERINKAIKKTEGKVESAPVATTAPAAEPTIVEAPVVEKKERRLAKDQMMVSVAPKTDIPDRVPASLKGKMYEIQIAGANAVIDSMEKNGAALNGDGTGVGKTRQIIAVAKYYADKGKVVFIISKNDALGKPFEGNGPYKLGGSMQKDSVDMGVDLTLFGHKQEKAKPGNIYITNYDRIQTDDVPDDAVVIFDEAHEMVNIYGENPGEKPTSQWAEKLRPIIKKSSSVAYYTATSGDKPHQFAYLHKILGFPTADDYFVAMIGNGVEVKKNRITSSKVKYSIPKGKGGNQFNEWINGLMLKAGAEGRFVKREISYDGTSIQFQDIKGTSEENPWSKYYTDSIEKMDEFERTGVRVSSPDDVKKFSAELTKIGTAIEILENELKSNRKVVMFFSRINEFIAKGSIQLKTPGANDTLPVELFTLPSPVDLVKEELKKRGIKFTELHGQSTTKASEAQRQFQEGDVSVMLASVESGGTGINLDDTKGTEPRSMIFMFAPYRGVSTIQALGRVWRSTTIQNDNNPTRFIFLTATDINADNIRSTVLAKKLQVMNATVGGTAVSMMPLSRIGFTTSMLVGSTLNDDQMLAQLEEPEQKKPSKPTRTPKAPPVNKPAVSDDGSPDPRKTDDLSVSSLTRQAYTPGEARKIGVTRLAADLGITSGGMEAIGEVLGRIARTGRRRHKKIASDLINVLQGTGVQIKLVSVDPMKNGWYDPATNTVFINLDGPHEMGVVETILHELVHAGTESAIRNPVTDAQKRLVESLRSQMADARKAAESLIRKKLGNDMDMSNWGRLVDRARMLNDYDFFDVVYGLSSLSEFSTHATTSKAFQQFLSTVEKGGKQMGLFDRFISAIARFFTGKTDFATDVYRDIVSLIGAGDKGSVRRPNYDSAAFEEYIGMPASAARGRAATPDELIKRFNLNYDALSASEKVVYDKVNSQTYLRNPWLAVLARRMREGRISAGEYADAAELVDPFVIKGPEEIPSYASIQKYMAMSKPTPTSEKLSKIGAEVPEGTVYEFRIDIPTYNASAEAGDTVYAITAHKPVPEGATRVGEVVSFVGIARVLNPTFMTRSISGKGDASMIAAGSGKTPLATVKGVYKSISEVPSDITDASVWTEVGYNPIRSSYFVDVRSKQAVVGGSEAIMIGPRVFVKDAVLEPRNRDAVPEGRADDNKMRVLYSAARGVTPEMDSEYLAAVEAGDMEKAQQMVDEAAKAAGFTILANHTSPNIFTVFNRRYRTEVLDMPNLIDESVIWFRKGEGKAKYGPRTYNVFLKLEDPWRTEGKTLGGENGWFKFARTVEAIAEDNNPETFVSHMKKQKWDGIEITNVNLDFDKFTVYGVFDPNQIKSADPVTYDDAGNVIPLSQRFQPESPDIRYSTARSTIENVLSLYAPALRITPEPTVTDPMFYDGVSLLTNESLMDGMDEDDIRAAAQRAAVAYNAASEDPLTSQVIQKPGFLLPSGLPDQYRRSVARGLMNAAQYAFENGIYPLAFELGTEADAFGATGMMLEQELASQARGVSAEMDAEYLTAVEAGDMEKAQQMADEAAEYSPFSRELWHGTTYTRYEEGKWTEGDASARGKLQAIAEQYGIKDWSSVANIFERWVDYGMASENGITVKDAVEARRLYEASKGTSKPGREVIGFEVFDMPSSGMELGVHLGTKQQAEAFGEVFRFKVSISNPLRLPDLGTWNYQSVMREARKRGVSISEAEYDEVFNARDENQAIRDLLIRKGYDGVIYRNEAEGKGDSYIVFSPNQIKSADPVTYDDAGNVIPLSQRFQPESPDIRFSTARGYVRIPGEKVIIDPRRDKILSKFRGRGMLTPEAFEATLVTEQEKRAGQQAARFLANNLNKAIETAFGKGTKNTKGLRVFVIDSKGNVSFTQPFETLKKAQDFAIKNGYAQYVIKSPEELINVALGNSEPSLTEKQQELLDEQEEKGITAIKNRIAIEIDKMLRTQNEYIAEAKKAGAPQSRFDEIANDKKIFQETIAQLQARLEAKLKKRREKLEEWMLNRNSKNFKDTQDEARSFLPAKVVEEIVNARDAIDGRSEEIAGIEYLMGDGMMRIIFEANNGIYVTRVYEAFESANRRNYADWLFEAYMAKVEGKTDEKGRPIKYDKLAAERIAPLVRVLTERLIDKRAKDIISDADQRMVDDVWSELVGRKFYKFIDQEAVKEGAKAELLRRRRRNKQLFISSLAQYLASDIDILLDADKMGRASGITPTSTPKEMLRAAKKVAADVYNNPEDNLDLLDDSGIDYNRMLIYRLPTKNEATDTARQQYQMAEAARRKGIPDPSGVKWRTGIGNTVYDSFIKALNHDFQKNLDFIIDAPGGKSGSSKSMEDWKKLGDQILMNRKNVPDYMRKFWGEIDNPANRVTQTIIKQSTLLANAAYRENIAKIGLAQGWAVEESEFKSDPAKYYGWRKLVSGDEGYEDNPLKDLYVHPEIYNSLEIRRSPNDPSNGAFKFIGGWVGVALWNATSGLLRGATRNLASLPNWALNSGVMLANPMEFARFWSNFGIAAKAISEHLSTVPKVEGGAEGDPKSIKIVKDSWAWMLQTYGFTGAGARVLGGAGSGLNAVSRFFGRLETKADSKAYQDLYTRAAREGIADNNIERNDMARLLNYEDDLTREPIRKNIDTFFPWGGVASKAQDAFGYIIKTGKATMGNRTEYYSSMDSMTKITLWLTEMESQAKIHAKDDAEFNKWRGEDGMFRELPAELQTKAAQNVNNTVQSDSRVAESVVQFRKSGWGKLMSPFLAARVEFIRTAANAYRIAFDEINNGVNSKEKARGFKRLLSVMMAHFVYASIATAFAVAVMRAVGGGEEDDDEGKTLNATELDGLRKMLPEWANNKVLAARVYKNGDIDWADVSFQLPFGWINEIFISASKGMDKAATDDLVAQTVAVQIVSDFIGNFSSRQIAIEAISNAMSGYDRIRNKEIWEKDDNLAVKIQKGVEYYFKSAGYPGDVRDAIKMYKAAYGVEENGSKYKMDAVLLSMATGQSIRTQKVSEMFLSEMRQAQDHYRVVNRSLYNSALRDANNVDRESVIEDTLLARRRFNEITRDLNQKFIAAVDVLKAGGMPHAKAKKMITDVMKSQEVKLSQSLERAIINNFIPPYQASDATKKKIKLLEKKYNDNRFKYHLEATNL